MTIIILSVALVRQRMFQLHWFTRRRDASQQGCDAMVLAGRVAGAERAPKETLHAQGATQALF
ncbi:hypothetical protein ABID97_002280 [Variovorax sp. OAS795]|uniref:hypothetical protein n=1 Tax=unclassified Variovorax TaxID=663243 RepID=UPI00339252D5